MKTIGFMAPKRVIATGTAVVALAACSEPADRTAQSDGGDRLPADMRTQLAGMFAAFDANGDGRAVRSELEAGNMTFTDHRTGETLEGEAAADAWFAMFDLNGDGVIEREEMFEAAEQLFDEHGDLRQ
ncbi:MAG: EF-hand domain-containing protein [Oceanicaulis sp.]